MRTQTFILPAFLFLCLFTYAQKNIVVKAEEKKVTIKKGLDGNDFYINLVITNNTNDTLSIPPVNSDIDRVLMKVGSQPKHYYIDKICFDYLLGFEPVNQIIAPKSIGRVRLHVIGSLFWKKRKYKVMFYPVITDPVTDKEVWVRSNKIIVNVE